MYPIKCFSYLKVNAHSRQPKLNSLLSMISTYAFSTIGFEPIKQLMIDLFAGVFPSTNASFFNNSSKRRFREILQGYGLPYVKLSK
jgi:hypothetical protein